MDDFDGGFAETEQCGWTAEACRRSQRKHGRGDDCPDHPWPLVFECIMSDQRDGHTVVVHVSGHWFADAVEAAELLIVPGQLFEGFTPFVTSVLSV